MLQSYAICNSVTCRVVALAGAELPARSLEVSLPCVLTGCPYRAMMCPHRQRARPDRSPVGPDHRQR